MLDGKLHHTGIARLAALAALASALAISAPPAHAQSYRNFESGQVRPLALSPDRSHLFAVNTPDNRLEIFSVSGAGLTHTGSVSVGLEPVAVAARTNGEVWVTNLLSDSVSIVDVAASPPRVVRTLLVGDEPRDIVFAGPGGNRAFVTTAHRGQNNPNDPQLTTAGIGRADVWVFEALNLGATLGGTPLTIITLFTDTPRALAVSPDGNTVYAAGFHTGNQTTSLSEGLVCDGGSGAAPCSVGGFTMPGGLPAPNTNFAGVPGPETGLIVKFNNATSQWQDQLSRNWNNAVRFSLPDRDVFAINAAAATPVSTSNFQHVGTILFNMVTNPISGKVYVSNTDAHNEVRFEGPGTFAGAPTVRGHLHEARITVLDGVNVLPRHLNKHINYAVVPSLAGVKDNSLATPTGMVVTSNGATLYVAAFGSSKIGVFSTASLENDTFVPSSASHIAVSGGGPTGLVLDEPRGRIYAFTRFDNSISTIDTTAAHEIAHQSVYSPEPASIVDGRPFLYDAFFTSSNGEASCASCHIFGDFDSLAWDLGNPDDAVLNNPNPMRLIQAGQDPDFHPLKGPMTTQSLRGMANFGPMHWRGDRTGGNDVGGNALDENAAFLKFNPAFVGLVGRSAQLSAQDMQDFATFILTVNYPPNPIRALDNSLNAVQTAGSNLFFGRTTDGFSNCNGCHTTNRAQGFFGSDGFSTFENEPQFFKVAHLRNLYQKVGMFGMAQVNGIGAGNNGNQGDQVRGFGFLHDGSIDTTSRFHRANVFNTTPTEEAQLEQFMLAFDTNLFPIAGQQVTLSSTNSGVAGPRIDLLIARDNAGECEIVVKGNVAGIQRGAVRLGNGLFQTDRAADPTLTDAQVRALAATAGQELTYTCVPPGEGTRIGIDRDEDGFFDRDELDAGSDPADPLSTPSASVPVVGIRSSAMTLGDDATPPINLDLRKVSFKSALFKGSPSGVVQPAFNSAGDPTVAGSSGGGAVLTIYNSAGSAQKTVLSLPAANWVATGTVASPTYKYTDTKRLVGPVTSVKIVKGTLTLAGKGAALYALANAPQSSMAIRLRLGTGVEMCAAAPAKQPSASNDTTAKFVGVPNTSAPASCPAVP